MPVKFQITNMILCDIYQVPVRGITKYESQINNRSQISKNANENNRMLLLRECQILYHCCTSTSTSIILFDIILQRTKFNISGLDSRCIILVSASGFWAILFSCYFVTSVAVTQ